MQMKYYSYIIMYSHTNFVKIFVDQALGDRSDEQNNTKQCFLPQTGRKRPMKGNKRYKSTRVGTERRKIYGIHKTGNRRAEQQKRFFCGWVSRKRHLQPDHERFFRLQSL
jgi:hypothetical protein